jgi:hypothetical protein
LLGELVETGLVERTEDGVKLTPEGEQLARQMAMSDEGGHDALMAGLLVEARSLSTPMRLP